MLFFEKRRLVWGERGREYEILVLDSIRVNGFIWGGNLKFEFNSKFVNLNSVVFFFSYI